MADAGEQTARGVQSPIRRKVAPRVLRQTNRTGPPLLIVGASARAAAWSAVRAGYRPLCLDHFADLDLQFLASAQQIQGGAPEFLEALESLPRCPLIYTGAFENDPDFIDQAAALHVLAGNPADILRQIRDPETLAGYVRKSGLTPLPLRPADDPPPTDGQWLLKPLASSAGRGVQLWDESAAGSPVLSEPHYFQERREGTSYSAVFVAPPDRGDVRFVGITEQLIGDRTFCDVPYRWCGNIGPVALAVQTELQVRRIANVCNWMGGLTGLFGVDFILDAAGQPWITEVNPRYPASAELLELITAQPLLLEHCACFDDVPLPEPMTFSAVESPALGKAVLYSRETVIVRQELHTGDGFDVGSFAPLADIPPAGTAIEAGHPILTVFATGRDIEDCRGTLRAKAREIEAELATSSAE